MKIKVCVTGYTVMVLLQMIWMCFKGEAYKAFWVALWLLPCFLCAGIRYVTKSDVVFTRCYALSFVVSWIFITSIAGNQVLLPWIYLAGGILLVSCGIREFIVEFFHTASLLLLFFVLFRHSVIFPKGKLWLFLVEMFLYGIGSLLVCIAVERGDLVAGIYTTNQEKKQQEKKQQEKEQQENEQEHPADQTKTEGSGSSLYGRTARRPSNSSEFVLNGKAYVAPEARILFVDDNALNVAMILELLEKYKIKPEVAKGGDVAFRMAKEKNYDLILLDYHMPGLNGIDTAEYIRNISGGYYDHVPIIAMTVASKEGIHEFFLTNGLDDFLIKPIDQNQLERIIKKWLPRSLLVEQPESVS